MFFEKYIRKNRPFIFFIYLFCLNQTEELVAQKTTLDLEYRFNPIYSRGFRQPLYEGDKPGFFTMQRTRLIANYKTDSLQAHVVLQDRRVWGEVSERQDVPEVAIFRAWIEKSLNSNLSIKLGRQGLVYDDQHIFGELNWGGTLAHDLALTKYQKNSFEAHVGLAFNANRLNELKREYYDRAFYKNMQFLWLHNEWESIKSSFLFVNHGLDLQDTTTNYSQTFGTNTSFQLSKNANLKGIYYHQLGKDVNDNDVNSFFWAVILRLKATNKLTLTLGAESTSGTDLSKYEINDPKSGTFDILYGLLHGHRGYLDYFYLLIDPVFGTNDYYIKAEFKPSKKIKVNNNLHLFQTQADSYAPSDLTFSNPLNSFLGVENDLVITKTWSKDFKASFGHSIMFGSNTLDEMFGGQKSKENQFFYLVITASPRLFGNK